MNDRTQAKPGTVQPDRIRQNTTKSDAKEAIGKTNPPSDAPRHSGTFGASQADKILQIPTKPDAESTIGKTNPRPLASRCRKPAQHLSQRQLAAVGLLCRGWNSVKTAQAIGVTRQTVWEWKRDPKFADALTRFSAEMLQSLLPDSGRGLDARRHPREREQQQRLVELCRRPTTQKTQSFDTLPRAHKLADPS